jgi:peptide deformylase
MNVKTVGLDENSVLKINTADSLKFDTTPAVVESIEIFKLVSEDSPILRKVLPEFDFSNPPVDPNKFASSLVESCKKYNGLGLSANQCGFEHRVFVMGAGDDFVAFFNPKILSASGEVHMKEGCLSFPLLGLSITRPKEILVEYQDFNGKKHTTKLVGISARCFLHELDHMNGIVFTSRAKPLALKTGVEKKNKMIKKLTSFYSIQSDPRLMKKHKN